ncbi:mitochondrial 37S ribosomal protein uS13m [Ascoidea rubescens DSM 1968]|uniref:Small ribosomal subunit protein uS13m n=1 Tax=Ascoidea rubescens DSM 1968 TaxID=1344418 RepID=A0A1D2VPW8_9ASCO|nr:ribosomal protein S13 [Ascoidea rubescens DSM 1968]ODV63673.1 ribosomal protein S13 [Ascoidea rubescens DSM 1968]
MVFIIGKRFLGKLPVRYALKKEIFGISKHEVEKICSKLFLYPKMRMHQLTEQNIMAITKELNDLEIENAKKTQIRDNIAFKKNIGSYAGMRHVLGLPVHGQRTKNNAKTAKKLNRLNRKL